MANPIKIQDFGIAVYNFTSVNVNLNIFTSQELKLEMFVRICLSYGKRCISTVRSKVPLVDPFVVKIWILVQCMEARGQRVVIAGNGLGDASSNPDRGCWYFPSC